MKTNIFKSTPKQRNQILNCHVGVGHLIYHSSENTTTEFDFYIDRLTNVIRYCENGDIATFHVFRDESKNFQFIPTEEEK